ncbi:helix-turn-helix domain-containing protein [Nonomuraea typhae]|uniref:Helix-turn-helix domain-containing protein n=1 Tax=Nonomuraea typhae TaxID=2603600 RepID=A0ABW7ZCV0_9ACTN
MPGERLTQQDRRQIAAGLADGHTYAAIARRLGRPTSTVTREVMRNSGPHAYHPERAQRAGENRTRRRASTPRGSAPDPGGHDPRTMERVAGHLADQMVLTGLPQMMARVMAALFTTDSGSLTSAELVRLLRVSPASISKAVGYLEAQELIRRERDPRRRADLYVIDDRTWYHALIASARLANLVATGAHDGARALGADSPAGARLENLGRFIVSVNEDLVRSAEHWSRVYFSPDS